MDWFTLGLFCFRVGGGVSACVTLWVSSSLRVFHLSLFPRYLLYFVVSNYYLG